MWKSTGSRRGAPKASGRRRSRVNSDASILQKHDHLSPGRERDCHSGRGAYVGGMKRLWLIVLLALIVVLAVSGVGGYNKLVRLGQAVDGQWAQVENAYQRRADLVPNLVATVKGAAKFEQDTLRQVTEARARVGQSQGASGAAAAPPDDAALQKY